MRCGIRLTEKDISDMKKYNNWGIDMGGLSMTDPKRYRKINAVLTEKGRKKDLLDIVETVPFESLYDLADDGPTPEEITFASEKKTAVRAALLSLKPREERVIRKRWGIGVDYSTGYEIGPELCVTASRAYSIEEKALRKLRHPYLRDFLDDA